MVQCKKEAINSIANALELHLPCTNPSKYPPNNVFKVMVKDKQDAPTPAITDGDIRVWVQQASILDMDK